MNTLKKEVRAIKAKAKKETGMSRKEAVAAIKKTYEKTGRISEIHYALINDSERDFVVLGYKRKTVSDYKREKLAELSAEQKAGIVEALVSGCAGHTFGEIAKAFNTTSEHILLIETARFKKTTQYVLKPVKDAPLCA